MRWNETNLIWGGLLMALGVVLLVANLGLLTFDPQLVFSLLFAAGGLAFLVASLTGRNRWWAMIPGFSLLALGALVAFGDAMPGGWAGAMFLGAIGLSFCLIYLRVGEWWPIIPGGSLLTLAAVAVASESWSGFDAGSIFFLGLGLTFALVALLGRPRHATGWAWWPAAALLAMSGLVAAAGADYMRAVLGVVLVALGGWQLLRPRRMEGR